VLFENGNILEKDVDVNELRKKIMAQTPIPLPMSIYENVAYGPKVHGVQGKAVLDGTVERCMRAAGLWDELKNRLSELASRLADYLMFIYFGNLIEHGPAEHAFNNPRDPRTKAYIDGLFG
jgi:ABC-type phosphate transport system ATPase subunit